MQRFLIEQPYHSELRDGEVFLKNATMLEFRELTWMTKRLGRYAQESFSGLTLAGRYPVFVKRSELSVKDGGCIVENDL